MQYIMKKPDLYIFGVEDMFMLFSQKEKKRMAADIPQRSSRDDWREVLGPDFPAPKERSA